MIRIRTARASLLAALLLLPGLAAAAGLNDTGITQCADDDENNLTCPQEPNFPRQDAETGRDAQTGLSKAGGGSAGFDFTKLDSDGTPLPANATNWDCVRDNVTGLIWEIKTDDGGLRDKDWLYTWYNPDPYTNGSTDTNTNDGAGSQGDSTSCNSTLLPSLCNTEAYVAAVNTLTTPLCGYTDWRMPTSDELRGIMDDSDVNLAIDAAYFPLTISWWYWSASPVAPYFEVARSVIFGLDLIGVHYAHKVGAAAVRLVRGGQWPATAPQGDTNPNFNPNVPATTPTDDFVLDNVYGTAYHKKTGLTWKRCAEKQAWNWNLDTQTGSCTGAANIYTWSEALQQGPAIGNFAGFSDWRLPNPKELGSIVEQRNWSPAINVKVFPNMPLWFLWSASPCPGCARSMANNIGLDGTESKDYGGYALLVRGGQYSLLSVAKAGTGSGTVTSNPPGIDCGKFCKGSFANEMFATAGEIILTATADANSVFDGWEGCTPLAEVNQCTFALSTAADTSVTANFSPKSQWTLYGFYQPVDMNVWNTVKGGSTVPFKFEVFAGPTELTDVAVIDSFTANGATCPGASTPTDDIEFTTTGGTSLRYDPVAGQFIQNWKTPKKPGTCYEVIMKTDDGSTLSAFFILK